MQDGDEAYVHLVSGECLVRLVLSERALLDTEALRDLWELDLELGPARAGGAETQPARAGPL